MIVFDFCQNSTWGSAQILSMHYIPQALISLRTIIPDKKVLVEVLFIW